ncbi:uncharacterized protein TOT_040000337 [Theileria orientalis strain Shintoku]|uniref:Cullin family profile domain-containing protein n=1 Tax=Theileria orientalis strain Shintoku TaxID=869250 RepID=J4C957_THEOR|nr:uncharacterized protein TOT_040000337 [Theileria orientalis strain Shintoku]BAM41958.1 uncharacterized protein TOT_040000337 [Theileria orientalis strain Shintoku]|eukprot:XP_009692259.1 uncharacterized protein TOT_040000337 [Theileria orientalis strain Shintoku]
MYKEESITFDSGWKRLKLEFIDKIERNLETYDLNNNDDRLIKLKPNEYITYYKLVYDMCTQKDSNYSEMLYNHLGQSLGEFIKNKVKNVILERCEDEDELVQLIYQYWVKYKSYINILKGIFSYLDRFYVPLALQPTVYEYAMAIFQKHILKQLKRKLTESLQVFDPYKENIRKYLLDSLDAKRRGDDLNNSHVSAIVEMYNKLDSTVGLQYKEDLEPQILERCSNYYKKIAPIWINDLSLLDYMYIIQYCIDDELDYCNKYLNKNTNESIYNTILTSLLYNQQDKINSKLKELNTLFDTYQTNDLKLIYKLTHKLNNINERIANSLKEYILGNIKENDSDHMIKFYNKYLYLIQFSFDNNNYILNVYHSIFKSYVNSSQFTSQLLSLFHDYIISKSSEEGEDEGLEESGSNANTNGSNAEENNKGHRVDDYVNVYNLLDDKNDFLNIYKMNMCYRLLTGKSHIDQETRVLNKLSHDEPNINHLYKMLDDIKKSNKLYWNYVSNKGSDMDIDTNQQLGSMGDEQGVTLVKHNKFIAICSVYWPISPSGFEDVRANEIFLNDLNEYQQYYKQNNKFKRFQYLHDYSPVEMVYEYRDHSSNDNTSPDAKMPERKITCNILQATLILMFNKVDSIKTDLVLSEMNIKYEQLIRIVESCQEFFNYDNDELSVNYEHLYRNRELNLINNIYKPLLTTGNRGKVKHRETLLENYNLIDSVIVKIMKKYKKLNQSNLLNILDTNFRNLHVSVNYTEQVS